MWIFGAFGNSDVYFKDLSNFTNNINDNLAMKEVIIVQNNKKEDDTKPWHKVLKGIKGLRQTISTYRNIVGCNMCIFGHPVAACWVRVLLATFQPLSDLCQQ